MAVQVVLDVGSSKVSALACCDRGGRACVLGFGVAACSGAAHGAVADVDAVARAIRDAVDAIGPSDRVAAQIGHFRSARPSSQEIALVLSPALGSSFSTSAVSRGLLQLDVDAFVHVQFK